MSKTGVLGDIKNKSFTVIKRDGREEPYYRRKMNRVALWACDGDETMADILLRDTVVKVKDKIKIKDLYRNLIETAESKVSQIQPFWQFVASKLYLLEMYAEAYNIKDKKYPHLMDVLKKGISSKVYDADIVSMYTPSEIEEINSFIDQERDLTFSINALKQFNKKYCKNYSKTKKLELPQITYIRVAMGLCYNLGSEFIPKMTKRRVEVIKDLYDILSKGYATLATPIMMNSLTPLNQFASCILNTIGNDTWDLMNKLVTAGLYTKGRGGLAFDITHIQAKGGYTKNGVETGGIVPFIRNIQAVVTSMMQCYDDKTEVLTENGFKLFKDVLENEKVTQYNLDGSIEFVLPTGRTEFDYSGKAYEYYGTHTSLVVTPNHRMLRLTESGNPVVEFAEKCEYNNKSKMIIAGNVKGSIVNFSYMDKLLVAFQADGHIDKNYKNVWQFNLSKKRKIERLEHILSMLPFEFKKHTFKHSVRFQVVVDDCTYEKYKDKSLSWIDIKNVDSSWIMEFINEVGYWDGTRKNSKTIRYSSTSKKDADIVQTLASMAGIRAHMSYYDKGGNNSRLWMVGFKYTNILNGGRRRTGIRKTIEKSEIQYNGKFYSVSVPSTFLVVRREDKISISGNSDSRRGSAVITCHWWHLDIEDFLQLKDASSGTDENRAHHLQYTLGTNDFLYNAVLNNEDVYLFDPIDVPELLYSHGDEWREYYEFYVNKHGIRRKKVKARDLFGHAFLKYAFQTGNVYEIMLDNVNDSNMLNRYIGSSNLCCEILEPSRPGKLIKESIITEDEEEYMVTKYEEEEIALCNLASFNCNIADLPEDEMDNIVYTVSLVIDNTIDIGRYMRAGGKKTNLDYRYVGLGYNNYANYMARHKVKLDDPKSHEVTFKLFDKISSSILYNNTVLAEQRGRFKKFDETKWAEGIIPYDLGNAVLKKKFGHLYDSDRAERIKGRIAKFGVRNALMSAIAPTASSATSRDLTESIEPILYYSYELDGAVSTRVLVPEFQELNQYYSLAYETDQKRLVVNNCIRQLFVDQSQSFNLYISEGNWNYKYLSDLHVLAWKLGGKTIYYTNTPKNSEHDGCDSCSA